MAGSPQQRRQYGVKDLGRKRKTESPCCSLGGLITFRLGWRVAANGFRGGLPASEEVQTHTDTTEGWCKDSKGA